jgi:hypothetical protein
MNAHDAPPHFGIFILIAVIGGVIAGILMFRKGGL